MKPIRYKVLLAAQMSVPDRDKVTALVSTLYTGVEAKEHSFRQVCPGQFVNEGWQYEVLDRIGRVGVMKYKGVESALFYKRQIGEIEPLPCDPVPEGVIKDPADAWVRLDLLGRSARQSRGILGSQKKSAEEALRLAERTVEVKEQLVWQLELDVINLNKDLQAKDAEIEKLKMEVRALKNPGVEPSTVRIPAPNRAARALARKGH